MEQKQAIADRLKQSNNILVTVSNNPSVDQLSACIGLTLALNKMGKHATAVFSGVVPSTIEFLQPEKTIEKNTDSLRDFIIALDKAKADKLRYKVEDKVVKIFITPYKTSISEKDLDFSQGDFNVDVVVALGVHQQADLDQAITSHGRILHDAAVVAINTQPGGELGTINWLDNSVSSLSELVAQLIDAIDKQVLDGQMATALLTGIVAETNRFSNEKTTPTTMSISAELMGAGANQQLVATKLQEPTPPPPVPKQDASPQGEGREDQPVDSHTSDDGTLEITHGGREEFRPDAQAGEGLEDHAVSSAGLDDQAPEAPEPVRPEPPEEPLSQIHIDEHGALESIEPFANKAPEQSLGDVGGSTDPTGHMASSHMILQPPASMSSPMSASGMSEDANADPLSLPQPDGPAFAGQGMFGQSPASATVAPPDMPYLPPSMTPGGTITPVNSTPSASPPAPDPEPPVQPVVPPAPSASFVPPTVTPPTPQVVQPTASTPVSQDSTPAQSSDQPGETLSQIEAEVHSPHLQAAAEPPASVPAAPSFPPAAPPDPMQTPAPADSAQAPVSADPPGADLASARDAVMQAIAAQPEPPVGPEPIQALNAQPLGEPLHEDQNPPAAAAPPSLDAAANPTFTLPDIPQQPGSGQAPPATPPPMMPPANFGQ